MLSLPMIQNVSLKTVGAIADSELQKYREDPKIPESQDCLL